MKVYNIILLVLLLCLISCTNNTNNTYNTTSETDIDNSSVETTSDTIYKVNVHCYHSTDIEYFDYSLKTIEYESDSPLIDNGFYEYIIKVFDENDSLKNTTILYSNCHSYKEQSLSNEINSFSDLDDIYVVLDYGRTVTYFSGRDSFPLVVNKLDDNKYIIVVGKCIHTLKDDEINDGKVNINTFKEAYYHYFMSHNRRNKSSDEWLNETNSYEFEDVYGNKIDDEYTLTNEPDAVYRIGFH